MLFFLFYFASENKIITFNLYIMDKVILSSLTAEYFQKLHSLASYLLTLKTRKVYSSSGETYFLGCEDFSLSVKDVELLKKLKHLHILSYD